MTGGRYLAEERGAFDLVEPVAARVEGEEAGTVATAPLFECAAAHDGQPAGDWLRMFKQIFGGAA